MRHAVKKIGYQWGKGKVTAQVRLNPDRSDRKRQFIKEYADAKKLEDAGTHVVVWMDESYCNQKHANQYTYFNPRDPESMLLKRGTGKGKRFIIIGAITKDGLLCELDEEEDYKFDPNERSADVVPDSILIFASGEVNEEKLRDYHKNMDGGSFESWINKRLIPAFKKQISRKENDPSYG